MDKRLWKAPAEIPIAEIPQRQVAGRYDQFVNDVLLRLANTSKKFGLLYQFESDDEAKLHGIAISDKGRERLGLGMIRKVRRGGNLYIFHGRNYTGA